MNKKERINLIIAVTLFIVLLIPIVFQYQNFVFHTFKNTFVHSKMYEARTDNFNVIFYQVKHDDKSMYLGDTTINVDDNLVTENESKLNVMINDHMYTQHLSQVSENKYYIEPMMLPYETINTISIGLSDVTMTSLSKIDYKCLAGQNKEFTLDNVFVYQNAIRFGQLDIMAKDKVLNMYPNIQIEYRYKNYLSKAKDSYITFYSISDQTSELIENLSKSIKEFNLPDDVLLENRPIEVVIILKGEEELTFNIELKNTGVEE